MKIIIIPNYPGVMGRPYSIASTLAEHGHEVHYFTWDLPYRMKIRKFIHHLATSLLSNQYQYENFTIHKVRRLPYFWPYVNGWLFKYQLKKLYRELDADIVFSESYTNETEVPKSLPLIYDLADDYAAPAEVYGSLIYKLAFKILGIRRTMKRQCEQALAVTVVSHPLYELAKRYNDKVVILPNGVDKEIIQAVLKDKATYPKNKYSMVYVTGFGQWSRPIETMQTVMELRKEYPEIDLTLIGAGIETKKIKEFIKLNQVEDYIHYLGLIRDRKTLFKLINEGNIGLHTSVKNKFRDAAQPIKVLEYSALGKKVVSVDLEGVKELNFSNVFIFSDKSKKNNMKQVMKRALEDRTSYRDYKTISGHVLKEYSWGKSVDELVRLISSVKAEGKQ